jgi:hypothetical protein
MEESLAVYDFCLYVSHNFEWVFDFFVWQPGHFWAVSAVFGVLFAAAIVAKTRFPKIHCWPLLVAFLLWLFLGFSERDCVIRKVDIRIDVVFVWPFFFIGTALLVVVFIVGLVYAVKAAKEEDRADGIASSSPLELIRVVGTAKAEGRGNTPASPPCCPSTQSPDPDSGR